MVKAKKHLGQHFLRNDGIARDIAEALSHKGYKKVLEIGPGTGVLSHFLLEGPSELFVAEIDVESVEYLEQNFEALQQHIIPGDFLRLNLAELMGEPFALIGNYPYNISSQIIFKMLDHVELIPEMVGMFQKEVADRLTAEPGSKTYGILSVLAAAFYDREFLFTVDPSEFIPPPKVFSGVIRFRRKEDYSLAVDRDLFRRIVKTAFNQRRKTLRNALKALNLPLDGIAADILQKRAEQLHYFEFVHLTEILSSP
jgi:16S rRNA (adenine1518-N6/adenine1519-N6)-dimethyltransferase